VDHATGKAPDMEEQKQGPKRTFTEEIEIAGNQLVDEIKNLIAKGNVRQIRIKDADGDTYLETPLTIGAIAGGVVVLAAPWLAILGVIAALVTRVRVEVVREEDTKHALKSVQKNKAKKAA
jgi:phage terminase large subunit-like protein